MRLLRRGLIALALSTTHTGGCFADLGATLEAHLNADVLMLGTHGIVTLRDACYPSNLYDPRVLVCRGEGTVEIRSLSIEDEGVLEEIDAPEDFGLPSRRDAVRVLRAVDYGSTIVSMTGIFSDGTERSASATVQVLPVERVTIRSVYGAMPRCDWGGSVNMPSGEPTSAYVFVGEERELVIDAWARDARGDLRVRVGGVFDVPPLYESSGVSHTFSTTLVEEDRIIGSRSVHRIVLHEPGDVHFETIVPSATSNEFRVRGVREADLVDITSVTETPDDVAPGQRVTFRAYPMDAERPYCGGPLFDERLSVAAEPSDICGVPSGYDGKGTFEVSFRSSGICRLLLSLPDMPSPSVQEIVVP